jgi:hypothetical protein
MSNDRFVIVASLAGVGQQQSVTPILDNSKPGSG